MKVIFLTLAIFLSSTSALAQKLPKWFRVYTFDDSLIEMNTSKVTLGGNVGRVSFRWTFDQPEPLGDESRLKYKSRLEVIEFDCSERRFRPYEVTFLNAAGKVIRSEKMTLPNEWRRPETMMVRLSDQACRLIRKDQRSPVVTREELELIRVARFAFLFSQQLQRNKDFKPLIERFFAARYLKLSRR